MAVLSHANRLGRFLSLRIPCSVIFAYGSNVNLQREIVPTKQEPIASDAPRP